MRVLFYKNDFAWPRASGHDVHTYNMMRGLSRLGARIGLVTRLPAPAPAIEDIEFDLLRALDTDAAPVTTPLQLSRLEEKFRSYWGVRREHVSALGAFAREFRANAVVVSGLEVLTMLGAVEGATRVWYAADEWFWHHMSQVRIGDHRTWSELNPAFTKLLYERAYRNRVDRVWVVSEPDARAMRWLAGMRNVDILPNGVDATYYRASADPGLPQSAAFWGRLDFGPNLQALEWFCGQVWPRVRERRPGATFTIIGFNPTAAAQALARLPGVSLQPNVPDIRTEVPHHAVVVLPFQSGGGIKNKLLEAAAMSRPTVCSPRAQLGLRGTPPVRVAASVTDWVQALERFWDDQALRERAGRELREWVSAHHSWESVARQAAEILDVRQRSHVAT